MYTKFRFNRHDILQLTDEAAEALEFHVDRNGALTPLLQVLETLRYDATGEFQNAVGDMIRNKSHTSK